MDFSYDDDQTALADAVKSLIGGAYSDFEQRRKVTADESGPGYDPKVWQQMAEMGLLGLAVPEDHDGVGAGPIEQAIVCQQIGRRLAPEPFLDCAVLPTALVNVCGTEEQKAAILSPLASGETMVGFADLEPGATGAHRGNAPTGVKATEADGGWTLDGVKEPVPYGASVDHLIVTAALPDGGVGLFHVDLGDAGDSVERTGYRTTDSGRAARVAFSGCAAKPLGDPAQDRSAELANALSLARILAGNQALGAMETLLKLTSEYLKSRKQFGVTLNTFQALTFRAADMYTSLELVSSMVNWATMVAAETPHGGEPLAIAADRTAVQVSNGGRHIGKEAIQLHGGIAVTAEYSVGWYTAHLTVLDHLYGDHTNALARLGANLGSYGVLDPLS